MAYRYEIAGADEQVSLAELDATIAAALDRAEDDEQRVSIALCLGPLVRLKRVLDREGVKAELAFDPGHQGVVRLVQADPDEAVRLAEGLSQLLDRDVGGPPPPVYAMEFTTAMEALCYLAVPPSA